MIASFEDGQIVLTDSYQYKDCRNRANANKSKTIPTPDKRL